VVAFPQARAGQGVRLARESTGKQVERSKLITSKRLHVVVLGNVRPVLLKHLSGVRVDFHLAYALVTGSLQAEVDAADTGE
jgi:hypothetical protein